MQTVGGALPGGLSRDVAELRERAGSTGASRRPRLRRRGGGDLGRGRSSTRPRLGSAGGRPRRPRPGDDRLRTRLGHGGIAALDTAHAALALGCRRCSRPASPPPTPRAPPRRQPPHPDRHAQLPSPPSRYRARRRGGPIATWGPAAGAIACARSPRTWRGYAASRAAGADDGRRDRGGAALLRRATGRGRAPPCVARDERRPGEPPAWRLRSSRRRRPRPRPGAEGALEGLVVDFLSFLELERASRETRERHRTNLLQVGEFLAAHDADALTVGAPTSPTPSPTWRRATAVRPARPRPSTARPPAWLLLQTPAARRADRRGPDRGSAPRAAPRSCPRSSTTPRCRAAGLAAWDKPTVVSHRACSR